MNHSSLPVIHPADIQEYDAINYLHAMAYPHCIHIKGSDSSRCRFVVTLLHGNEPSGLVAVLQLIKEQLKPVCDIYIAVMNVSAALSPPFFTYRQLPGKRDLNRCFKPPYDDTEGQLAQLLLELIHQKNPESLLDIHNTSGMGPAFGVAIHLDSKHDALVSLFTERLIVTDLKLGALMELSEADVPTVTIECGGADDPESSRIAFDGLKRYFLKEDLYNLDNAPWPIEVLHNPVRLELDDGAKIAYAEGHSDNVDVTLAADIEHYNFGTVSPDTLLGWLNPEKRHLLKVRTARGEEQLEDWFQCRNGELRPARTLKLFMITSRADIAKSDCLLYAVRSK